MCTTYTLSKINQLIDIGGKLSKSWFRGHEKMVGELTPRIHREAYSSEMYRKFRPNVESAFAEKFKRKAPVLAGAKKLPAIDDHLGWLCLMQHHGTPTRLLDWTENALVALWFAVAEEKEKDGELWAMHPKWLNKISCGFFGIPVMGGNPEVKFLARQPYWEGNRKDLAEELELDGPVTGPSALMPQKSFRKMIVQSSTFTIHPDPEEGETTTITELLTDKEHLCRWIIPEDKKRELKEALMDLGITHDTLFPNLDGLSKQITEKGQEVRYTPPDPPKCDGLWDPAGEKKDGSD